MGTKYVRDRMATITVASQVNDESQAFESTSDSLKPIAITGNPKSRNPENGIRNPETGIQKPETKNKANCCSHRKLSTWQFVKGSTDYKHLTGCCFCLIFDRM